MSDSLEKSLTELIETKLNKIEDKIDGTINKMVKEEMDNAVKNYVNELKEVIFSELMNTLLDKYREMEMKQQITSNKIDV
jgi:hypothetical protein